MKKLLSILLCLLMLVGVFTACGTDPLANGGIHVEEEDGGNGGTGNGDGNGTPATTAKAAKYGLFMYGPVEYELDANGRLSAIWMLDESMERNYEMMGGNGVDEIAMYEFVYGDDGKLTAFRTFGREYPISYDANGNATADMGGEIVTMMLTYHANGSIKEMMADNDGSLSGYKFDEAGRFTELTITTGRMGEPDEEGGEPPKPEFSTAVYTYVYEGNKVTMTGTENGEALEGSLVMEFDAAGKPVKVTEEEGEESLTMTWKWNGDQVVEMITSDYDYSEEGGKRQVEVRTVYTYDDNGKRTRIDEYVDDVLDNYELRTYNEAGKLLTEVLYEADGTEVYRRENKYTADGKFDGYSTTSHGTTTNYDADGNYIDSTETTP